MKKIVFCNIALIFLVAFSYSFTQAMQQAKSKVARLFVAADIPVDTSNVRTFVGNRINGFREESHPHLTLIFIGDVPKNKIGKITKILDKSVNLFENAHPGIKKYNGIHGFYIENKAHRFGNKAIVLNLNDINSQRSGIKLLQELRNIIESNLKNKNIIGSCLAFVPHITIGTLDLQKTISQNQLYNILNKVNAPQNSSNFTINSVTLYQSKKGKYKPLKTWYF